MRSTQAWAKNRCESNRDDLRGDPSIPLDFDHFQNTCTVFSINSSTKFV